MGSSKLAYEPHPTLHRETRTALRLFHLEFVAYRHLTFDLLHKLTLLSLSAFLLGHFLL